MFKLHQQSLKSRMMRITWRIFIERWIICRVKWRN